MVALRIGAILTLGLLAVYYILRASAAQCSGLQCDRYIGFSLLLPLLVLIMAAVTGLLAISAATRGAQIAQDQAIKQRQTTWLGILSICTLVSVLGPIVSLAVFRSSPDVLVPVATLLVLLVPLSVLIYSFTSVR
jgi:hypothetical protein